MREIYNYINNTWVDVKGGESVDVFNPATGDLLTKTPLSSRSDLEKAVQAAKDAWWDWRKTPATDRIQYLFKLKKLLDDNIDEISQTITLECGKTFDESKGEMRRAIENIEVACGIPILTQGIISEDIAPGVDEIMIRQPVGVAAAICPFNFPGMIPFWFLPYALACGNTYIVKPSEKVPLTMQKIFQLVELIGLPPGVLNLINGSKEAVDGLLMHPDVRAISFVGSTMVAKYIYSQGAAHGKRVQAQGGAKNPIVVMPDADVETAVRITADSAFGCAGQRCLATSLVITVGAARELFVEAICDAATSRVVGFGMNPGVQMGPVISRQSKTRIENLIEQAHREGANIAVDGRAPTISGYENGFFVKPTILLDVPPHGEVFRTEIFGPVLGLVHVNTIEEAILLINSAQYGNQASIFTTSGHIARKFRYEVEAGNIGINIGVAAPMAFFPFSGWKESFFGDLHGQGMDAVDFYTQKKVVVERWPREWTRKF
jgi:malonate-semialdehyde dehydrogenase (acetylating)/methylmalonate-semialdehyde dehydrogenase